MKADSERRSFNLYVKLFWLLLRIGMDFTKSKKPIIDAGRSTGIFGGQIAKNMGAVMVPVRTFAVTA